MKKTCINPSCQRRFTVNRYNSHHHDYCGRPDCLRYRDRVRKRRSRQNHPPDANFRAREVKRVQEYRKRKKESSTAGVLAGLETSFVTSRPLTTDLMARIEEQSLILIGLAGQFGGFSDRKSVTDFLSRCRKRGREFSTMTLQPP